ncbi:MAG TPA: tetratricopeptide repeat protein, partial [Gemmatimonadales bacterium]|nr:tetratricopeptide repeat protein [Gemmatimonadales bacterium]
MIALVAGLTAATSSNTRPVCAQDTDAANVAAAREHFEKARTFYGQGAYREAVAELEAAHALDPSAKDLVFNLGVVHEKLADIDEALQWFQLYTTMNLTAQERERADAYIKRLEGAKRELPTPPENLTPPAGNRPAAISPAQAESPRHGRIDAATLAFAGVACGALAISTVVGIKAIVDRPKSGLVTGQDVSFADLTHRVSVAHTEAVVADVGFGVSFAAGVAAAILYFSRP